MTCDNCQAPTGGLFSWFGARVCGTCIGRLRFRLIKFQIAKRMERKQLSQTEPMTS